MVKSNHSQYFILLDAAWKQFSKAHPKENPAYCLISQDVEDFLESEQIGFLCPMIVDEEMSEKTMCLIHASL